MKILFDCREETRNTTGIGTYVRNLAREIRTRQERAPECVCVPERPVLPPTARMRSRGEQFAHFLKNLYWKQVYLPARAMRERADLLLCMDPIAPLAHPGKLAIIIYDLIFLTGTAQTDAWTRYWRLMVPLSARRADGIFTFSKATRQEIIRTLGVDGNRISLIRTGVAGHFRQIKWSQEEQERVREKLRLPPSFILTIGAHDPRRNVKRLLDAFGDLASRRTIPHTLVLIGPKTPFFAEVWRHTQNLGLTEKVLYLDYVPNEQLSLYYNLADVYVYPSLEEGFGLTPLEAMACGCPVITSDTSSLPEVVGDAALLIDPTSTESLTIAMERVLLDAQEREELIRRGSERATHFSWKLGVQDLLNGCEEILIKRHV